MKAFPAIFCILVLVSALALMAIPTASADPDIDYITLLIADGGSPETAFDIGVVGAYCDGTNLHIAHGIGVGYMDEGWEITGEHFEVIPYTDNMDVIYDGFHLTKSGNPKVGHFTYSYEGWMWHVIPLSEIGVEPGDTVLIAAHADFVQYGDNPDTIEVEDDYPLRYESAWGEGEDFPGNNWAMYFEYTIQEDEF